MEQEHLAVGAFAQLTERACVLGSAPEVIALLARAAADEVRHAEVCRRMAVRHLGADAVPERFRGVPALAAYPGCTDAEALLLDVATICCLSETFTVAYFTEMLERARHPTARAVVASLLEDEVFHGRAGWAYLASVAAPDVNAFLAGALPALLEATVADVVDTARDHPEGDDPRREAHGWLGMDTGAAIYRRTLRDVVLPGFEALGVDTRAATKLARARAWLKRA
jgi:hypothetical protein